MSLESDLKNIIESVNLKLYGTEVTTESGQTIYRVMVHKSGGVTMQECVDVTKLISPMLDVTPPMRSEYRLEVSSPGIERALKTIENFTLSVGEKAKVTLIDHTLLKGEILSVNKNEIEINDIDSKEKVKFDFSDVHKARTYFEW